MAKHSKSLVSGGLIKSDKLKTVLLLFSCFIIPCIVLLCVYGAYNIAPFGDKSVLIMDMSGQYSEFFCGLKNISSQEGGILFSWAKTFGSNYAGVFAYYVASPLSLLTLFCPNAYMPIGLAFLTVLKVGLCGMTFGILMNHFDKNKARTVVFALLYALMSYNIVYSMCLMWIDAVIWLPIVILGIEKIADGGKPYILCISLTALFISTYYMSFMVGIFACLYVYYIVVRQKRDPLKKIGIFLGKFAGSAIIAACLGAWLLLPTAASLFEGKIGSTFATPENGLNYETKNILSKFFIGTYDSITNTGTPFFYLGIIAFMFFIAYFFIKSIPLREKVTIGSIVLFIGISTYYFELDLMWHVFQKPNWFPYRYFFVFGFIVIYAACKAAFKFKEIPLGYFVGFVLLDYLIYKIIYDTGSTFVSEENYNATIKYLLIIGALVIALSWLQNKGTAFFEKMLSKNKRKTDKNYYSEKANKILQYVSVCLVVCILLTSCFEIYTNAMGLTEGLDKAHRYESNGKYYEYKILTQDLADKADELSKDEFYRMGSCFQRNFNESIGLGYGGISHYSSSYNSAINDFLAQMGFAQVYFWSSYAGSTMLTDALFSMKYVMSDPNISRMDDNGKIISWCNMPFDSYKAVYKKDSAILYENPYMLTPCIAVSSDLKKFDYQKNDVESQNYLLNCILGNSENQDYFKKVIYYVLNDPTAPPPEGGYLLSEGNHRISYTISAAETGPLYAYLPYNGSKVSKMTINGKNEVKLYTSETNCIQFLGCYEKGEIVKVDIMGEAYTNGNAFYSLNENLFASSIEKLRENSLNITNWSSGYMEGKIKADEAGSVFTSFAYDKSWSVKVDGKEVETWSIKDALLAFDIPKGEHEIVFEYNVPGFNVGMVISVVTLTGIVVWFALKKSLYKYIRQRATKE